MLTQESNLLRPRKLFLVFPYFMVHYVASEAVVSPRDVTHVINSVFLLLNFIGRVKKKRNNITDIVLQLEVADETRAKKCVCSTQASHKYTSRPQENHSRKCFGERSMISRTRSR